MPAAAPRPCTTPGCRRLIPYGQQCPDHPRNWAKQDKKRGNRHQRGYGNDWVKLRNSIMLRDKGLCQPCLAAGKVAPATEVDHIVPKAEGGSDYPGNLQAICNACHSVKTAFESRGESAQAMPEWLPKPRVPVVVIAGPPGSGKREYANSIASSTDLVIDLNEIAAKQQNVSVDLASSLPKPARMMAIRVRNRLLASLASIDCSYGKALLTVIAGKPEHRQWWVSKLNASLVVMTAPKDECRARIRAMGLPAVRELELIHLIDTWR